MTKIWAHRGASGYAPENTLAAFRLAKEQGADGVELDVQLSADGEVVVIHDETVDRTTDGIGWVKDLTFAQLRRLNASTGSVDHPHEVIPALGEVLDLLDDSPMMVNIELKDSRVVCPGLAEKVLALVGGRNWERRAILSSFNHMTLSHIRDLHSLIPTGVLFSDVLYEPWDYAQRFGATALHPHFLYAQLADTCVDEAHRRALAVNVWTVNEEDDMDRVIRLGVDGVITNYPDRAVERLTVLTGE